jgi:hypothetical protein
VKQKLFFLFFACVVVQMSLWKVKSSCAQTAVSRNNGDINLWISGGLGVAVGNFAGESSGPGLCASLSAQRGNELFTFRYSRGSDLSLFASPSESAWDFGLLYGRISNSKLGRASISGGIALAGVTRRGRLVSGGWFNSEYEENTSILPGIPLQGELFFTPTSFLGVGVIAFADLNIRRSVFGATLGLTVGKLR